MSEEAINIIIKGVNSDMDVSYQPEGTIRDSLNGEFIPSVENLVNGEIESSGISNWRRRKSTDLFGSTSDSVITGWTKYRNYLVTIERIGNTGLRIVERSLFDFSDTRVIFQDLNAHDKINVRDPIKRVIPLYESNQVIRLIINNGIDCPFVITYSSTTGCNDSLNECFLTPDYKMSEIQISGIYEGYGSVEEGTYYMAYRMYGLSGSVTNWSLMSRPIQIVASVMTTDTYEQYHILSSSSPGTRSSKMIQILIPNQDANYDYIQIAYFKTIEGGIDPNGVIWYDGSKKSGYVYNMYGTEDLGTILIDDVLNTTVNIVKAQDIALAKNQLIIANVEERAELDIPASMTDASISTLNTSNNIVIDTRNNYSFENYNFGTFGYPGGPEALTAPRPLYGIVKEYESNSLTVLNQYCWYQSSSSVGLVTDPTHSTADISVTIGHYYYTTEILYVLFGTMVPVFRTIAYNDNSIGIGNSVYNSVDLKNNSNGLSDYKNPKLVSNALGYPSESKVRLGIMPIKNGKPYLVRNIGMVTFGNRVSERLIRPIGNVSVDVDNYFYRQYNAGVNHIKIDRLDITDLISEACDSFAIVRSKIQDDTISTGILEPVVEIDTNQVGRCDRFTYDTGIVYSKTFFYVSPELLLEPNKYSLQPGDKIEIYAYAKPEFARYKYEVWRSYAGIKECSLTPIGTGMMNTYQKFGELINHTSIDGNYYSQIGHTVTVKRVIKVGIGDKDISFDETNPDMLFHNVGYTLNDGARDRKTIGGVGFLITIVEDVNFGLGNTNIPYATLVKHKRDGYSSTEASNPVGVSMDGTRYYSTGHFQNLDTIFKTKTFDVTEQRFILRDTEIFGGNTYIGFFGNQRLYNDEINNTNPYTLSNGIIFPYESKINVSLREGGFYGKLRQYNLLMPEGLRYATSNMKLEDFNYNDALSAYLPDAPYNQIPYNFRNIYNHEKRCYVSETKVQNERIDTFRLFRPQKFIDVYTSNDPIIRVESEGNYLFYWTWNSIGYMPVEERSTVPTTLGTPMTLGISGVLDRHDEIDSTVGLQNFFGLTKTYDGFVWIDAKRKKMIFMNRSGNINNANIVPGLDSVLKSAISNELLKFENPVNPYTDDLFGDHSPGDNPIGIVSCYNPDDRNVYFVIFNGTTGNYNISFNSYMQAYSGRHDFYPIMMLNIGSNMLGRVISESSGRNDALDVYIHGTNETLQYGYSYGKQVESSLQIVVNKDSQIRKIFDIFEIEKSGGFFDVIKFNNGFQNETEEPNNNEYYTDLYDRVRSGFPLVDEARFQGTGYMIYEFIIDIEHDNSDKVEIKKVITKYRRDI